MRGKKMGTQIHHTRFSEVSFNGPFDESEREKLLSLIEKIESESKHPRGVRLWQWAYCCSQLGEGKAYFLNCSGYPGVMVGESLEELIEEARTSFRRWAGSSKQG